MKTRECDVFCNPHRSVDGLWQVRVQVVRFLGLVRAFSHTVHLRVIGSGHFNRSELPPLPFPITPDPSPTNSSAPSSPLLPKNLFPQMINMANIFYMPACRECAAPLFNNTKPRELIQFFEELEYLFTCADLKDETEKKKHVLWYVDFDIEQIWKTFPEFSDVTKTYLHFKAAILVHYPDASGDYVYSLHNMDLLIGECQRLEISNTVNLADYHLKFLAITSWLIQKQQLGTSEQQCGYLRGFQPRLLALSSKYSPHHPRCLWGGLIYFTKCYHRSPELFLTNSLERKPPLCPWRCRLDSKKRAIV